MIENDQMNSFVFLDFYGFNILFMSINVSINFSNDFGMNLQ